MLLLHGEPSWAYLYRSIPGAAGLPHDRLPEASHFLQDDQGEEIARRLVGFYAAEPLGR